MSLRPGMRLEQYEIAAPIGAGGMGEVYRARDTRLGRDVAIKVLPHRLADDPEALARFEREAKALAALSHPNILTIFDFGTEQEVTYAVMELLEGEPLRKKIQRGPIPTNRIIEIGSAITEGLAAAHSRGIIHRDLKPENIFLIAGGGIKILDFGLARMEAVEKLEGGSRFQTISETQPGAVLGTIGYMSPEQVRGQALDQRTDIFSLGVILYEMATGKCPFARDTAADTMAAILNYEPAELTATGSEIPPELDRLILHCLEKDPDHRFQSARDLTFDFKEIASGVRLTKPIPQRTERQSTVAKILIAAFALCFILAGFWWFNRIQNHADSGTRIPVAVADFVNETGEPDLDGLSGMLITSLEQSRKLSVMTRSRMLDVMKQLGQQNPGRIDEHLGREICKQANVNALILASIRKFDQLYTIDLKVLDPQKNEYLFTAKQEGTGKSSVPQLIDELSEATRKGLKEKVAEIEKANRKVTEVTTSNLAAYQHFFKGEEHINQLQFKEATQEFRKAVEIDPTFALAYVRMTYATSWISLERAREPLQKALQLIDRLPEKDRLVILATKAYVDRNYEEASAQLDRYLQMYPDEKEALFTRGDWYYHFGEVEKGKEYFIRVLQIDANFERAYQHLVWANQCLMRHDEAIRVAKEYAARAKSPESLRQLVQSLVNNGEYDAAEKALDGAERIAPADAADDIRSGRAEISLYRGKYEEAENFCKQIRNTQTNDSESLAYACLTNVYAYTGRFEEAIKAKEAQINLRLQRKEVHQLADDYSTVAFLYYWGLNNHEEANTHLDRALQYAKDSDEVLHLLFDMLNLIGRPEDAARVAEQNLWGHRPFTAEAIRATKNYNAGNYKAAIQDFEILASRGHTFERYFSLYMIARCYLELKQYDRTIQQMEKIIDSPIIRTFWEQVDFHYLFAQSLDLNGDKQRAKQHYEKVLHIWRLADPNHPSLIEARRKTRS